MSTYRYLAEYVSAVGQQAELAQAVETNTAQAITEAKARVLAQATETEIAQPVTRSKSRVLAQVVETDTAQALANKTKQKIVNQVVETSTAQVIAQAKTKALAQTIETSSAQAIGHSFARTLAQTTETDLAQALAKVKQKIINQVTEEDIAQTVGTRICPILASLRPNGTGTVTNIEDQGGGTTNLHLAVDDDPDSNDGDTTRLQRPGLPPGSTDGQCFLLLDDMPVTFSSMCRLEVKVAASNNDGTRVDDDLILYAQVFQSDESTALSNEVQIANYTELTGAYVVFNKTPTGLVAGTKTLWDGARLRLRWDYTQAGALSESLDIRVTAVELNGSYLAISGAVAVNQVTETDTAQVLGRAKQKVLAQAVSTELAQAVTASKSRVLAQVVEADSVFGLAKTKQEALAQVTEVETAQAITEAKSRVIGMTALNVSLLTADGSTVDGTSYSTANVSPVANSLLALWVTHAVTGGTTVSSVSGLGLTWTLQKRLTISASTKIELWTAPVGATPNSGQVTITMAATVGSLVWHLQQVTDQDAVPLVLTNLPTNTGAGTDTSVAYATAEKPSNRFLFGCGAAANVSQIPRAGWSELADTSQTGPSCSMATQWRSDVAEATGSSTLSVSANWGVIGVELSAAFLPVTETDVVQPMGHSLSRTLAQATEADLTQVVGKTKVKEINQVVETDLAQVVSPTSSVDLAQVIETDLTQALTKTKAKSLSQVAETDVVNDGQDLIPLKSRELTQAVETDLTQPMTKAKAKIVPQAVETDLAQFITESKAKGISQLTETDLAQHVTVGYKALHLTSQAADAEVTVGAGTKHKAAFPPGSSSVIRNKNTVLGPTAPLQVTDSAVAGTDGTAISWYSPRLKAVTIAGAITVELWARESSGLANAAPTIRVERCSLDGTVLSTIVAETVNHGAGEMDTTAGGTSDTFTVTAANVTDTALADGDRLRLTLWIDDAADQGGLPTDAMTSGQNAQFYVNGSRGAAGQAAFTFTETLVPFAAAALTQVIEVDTAQPVTRAKARALAQATATELARPLGRSKSKVLTPVVEANQAQPLAHALSRTLDQVTETDTAAVLVASKRLGIGQATETDLAQALALGAAVVVVEVRLHGREPAGTVAGEEPAARLHGRESRGALTGREPAVRLHGREPGSS